MLKYVKIHVYNIVYVFLKILQIHLNDHRDLNKHPLKLKANVRHLQALFDSTASFG